MVVARAVSRKTPIYFIIIAALLNNATGKIGILWLYVAWAQQPMTRNTKPLQLKRKNAQEQDVTIILLKKECHPNASKNALKQVDK